MTLVIVNFIFPWEAINTFRNSLGFHKHFQLKYIDLAVVSPCICHKDQQAIHVALSNPNVSKDIIFFFLKS